MTRISLTPSLSLVCMGLAAVALNAGQGAQAPALRADAPAGAVPPPWVYTINAPTPPGAVPAPEDASPKRVVGSTVSLTPAQLRDVFNPPDWHPENHPTPP